MTYRFDKTEVPQFDLDCEGMGLNSQGKACIACGEPRVDHSTGLCRPCWRIVVLGPSIEGKALDEAIAHHLDIYHGDP